jgi:predicted RNase H-like HicB family nuclease
MARKSGPTATERKSSPSVKGSRTSATSSSAHNTPTPNQVGEVSRETDEAPLRTIFNPLPLRAKVVIHRAKEGGFWAEVPALPGCITEGDTYEELLANLRDAIGGCLLVFPGDYKQEEEGWTEEIDL